MALPDRVVTSLGSVRAHTRKVAEEVAWRWPVVFIWGMGPTGEHAQGRALDFMGYQLGGGVSSPGPNRPAMLREIADHLWADRARLGVWYVIYRQQIISINNNSYGPTGRWNPMPDRGNSTANHIDHVHVSFVNAPPAYKAPSDSPPPEEDDMFTDEDRRRLRHLHIALTNSNAAQVRHPDSDQTSSARYGVERAWLHSWRTRNALDGLIAMVADHIAEGAGIDPDQLQSDIRKSVKDGVIQGLEVQTEAFADAVLERLGNVEVSTDAVTEAIRAILLDGVGSEEDDS